MTHEILSKDNVLSDFAYAEPIAIVGVSCRFPNTCDTPAKFWDLLEQSKSTVRKIPEDRWQSYYDSSAKIAASLRSATQFGSYLDEIDGFDADFFGISAREAEYIDPQQRAILELSWEALETAGVVPSSLKGTDAGVFMAANSFDFGHRLMSDVTSIAPWTVNGGMLFGIANRVSYALDLRGPSMVIDTACAGSLTAVHLACQSLWQGETGIALAGGVNIMSNPGMTIALDAAGATSADGRSKAFDASADGYGRGEGAAVVVLKRLSDALEENSPIIALIRGSGIFQDGRTVGMMAPNSDAQEAMLRSVYRRFDIDPGSIQYVEAHGTGTQAGDCAEIGALSRFFGEGRAASDPCLIGSAKPNVGHLEAGAGMVGLVKTILSLQHESLVPNVLGELNPTIDWAASGLKVVDRPIAWRRSSRVRRAGVSCFGVGGTIAHTILEEAPAKSRRRAPAADATSPSGTAGVFAISARSSSSLQQNAARLADWIDGQADIDLAAVGRTLGLRRDHLHKRAVVVATSVESLQQGLRRLADGRGDHVGDATLDDGDRVHRAVWVFSGHGAQWVGMGQELLATDATFAAALDRLDPIFKDELGYTVREAIADSDWSTVERVQAVTFAIQIGLAAVWKSRGLIPGAVIGHSVGEVAASVVAGILTVEDAARFACRRAAIYQRLDGRGAMAMVRLSFAETKAKLAGHARVVAAIAASPVGTVISGDTDALDAIVAAWKAERISIKKVATAAAFHSPQIDDLLDDIRAASSDLVCRPPTLPAYTTTLDDPRSFAPRDAAFWATNSRGAVRLLDAVEAALDDGFRSFVEISASPIVASSIRETVDTMSRDDVLVCASLKPKRPESGALTDTLATLYCNGESIDWAAAHPGVGFVDLPTMAWTHRRFWPTVSAAKASAHRAGHVPESHTILGHKDVVRTTSPIALWRTQLDFDTRPYPGTHPIFGVEIVPAAALLHTIMKAAENGAENRHLRDIALKTPVPVEHPLDVQIIGQDGFFQIISRQIHDDDPTSEDWWTVHTTAQVDRADPVVPEPIDIPALFARYRDEWSWDRIEDLYRKRGIGDYGFKWRIETLMRGPGGIVARFGFAPDTTPRSWAEVLDGALTICPLLLPDDEILRMPAHIERFAAHDTGAPDRFVVHATVLHDAATPDSDDCRLHLTVLATDGRVVGEIGGLLFAPLEHTARPRSAPDRLVFRQEWRPLEEPAEAAPAPGRIVLVGTPSPIRDALLASLIARGIEVEAAAERPAVGLSDDATVLLLGAETDDDAAIEQTAERNAWSAITAAQALAGADGNGRPARLWFVTHGARRGGTAAALVQAPLWGIGRIVAGERPDLWGGVVDLDTDGTSIDALVPGLLRIVATRPDQDVVSLTGEGASVLRLVSACLAKPGAEESTVPRSRCACRSDSTYLVTGGLGALGLQAARYLVGRGARRLILAGRGGLPERALWSQQDNPATKATIGAIKELEALGVTIHVAAVDIADAGSIQHELSASRLGLPPIRGIVHAAGVFEGGMLGQIDRAALRSIFQAKVGGTMALHRMFPAGTLDFFVPFSSSGQFARLSGQSGYAAANAFLDGFGRFRAGLGHADTFSLGWMAWRGIGMSRSIAATMIEARANGIDEIDTDDALNAWRHAEQLDDDYLAVFAPVDSGSSRLRLFEEIASDEPATSPQNEAVRVADLPADGRQDWLVTDVRSLVAEEMRTEPDSIDQRRSLIDMGVDSLMTVSLRIRLKKRYGFEFPPTLLWNNPSVFAIAGFIDQHAS